MRKFQIGEVLDLEKFREVSDLGEVSDSGKFQILGKILNNRFAYRGIWAPIRSIISR